MRCQTDTTKDPEDRNCGHLFRAYKACMDKVAAEAAAARAKK